MPSGKTTITKNLETRELVIERILDAPRQLVWAGWTKPEHITSWWGPIGWKATVYEMNVRPGGVWRYGLRPADGVGQETWGKAVYQAVREPSFLHYIDTFSDEQGNAIGDSKMDTTVEFIEHGEATKLLIRIKFATTEELESAEDVGMIEGFAETLERFNNYLSNLKI